MLFRNVLTICFIVYVLGVVFGFNLPLEYGFVDHNNLLGQFSFNYYTESSGKVLIHIIGNNITMVLINLIGGFSFGTISILNLFYNGSILGYSSHVALTYFSPFEFAKHFIPHSLEIVGIIISSTIGVRLGIFLFSKFVLQKKCTFDYRVHIRYGLLSILITIVSAFIEVFVSLRI